MEDAATAGSDIAPLQPSDLIGWVAAVGGMLAFGTFGVPIKSDTAKSLDIDPLVFQSYKTAMCFLTSWLVLLFDEEFSFTPWGIVSGLFWVPGGVATIYAVKTAGLAIGIGVGSSFIVLVSFTWGIFVFNEHVHSKIGATMAVTCMMIGLLGMAYFSAPSQSHADEQSPVPSTPDVSYDYQGLNSVGTDDGGIDDTTDTLDNAIQDPLSNNRTTDTEYRDHDGGNSTTAVEHTNPKMTTVQDKSNRSSNVTTTVGSASEDNDDDVVLVEMSDGILQSGNGHPSARVADSKHVQLCGFKIPRHYTGIAAAAFTGIWGGSIMVPMQWSPKNEKGSHYLISFAIGATIVNIALWILRYCSLVVRHRSAKTAYYALPSFYIRKMWLYGGTSGLLWSIGNFCSILSVEYLGEGVGYSVVQASMLVSGLWGIFYFHEIRGVPTITRWFLSASLTVFGILSLSYEHHEK